MQRKPNIKWRASDVEKLTKEVQKFNAKVSRTKKAHPEMADILPKSIKKKDIMQSVTTRQEFNKTLKSVDRFTKKGAEKPITSKTGNTVTKWEKNEVGLKVAQINRERTKERKLIENMNVSSQGKPIGLKRGEMGSERLQALQPKKFDFDKIKGGKEWDKFVESVTKQASPYFKTEKMERYKANYIKGLQSVFGDSAQDLIDTIQSIPADKVVETFFAEQEASIDFIYDPIELQARQDILEEIWGSIADEINEETDS